MNRFSRTASVVLIAGVFLSMAVAVLTIVKQGKAYDRKAPVWRILFSKQKAADKPGIVVLNVYGPIEISSGRSPFGGGSAAGSDSLVERLDAVGREKNIKAVVLRINSPGGTIGSVQEIYQKLRELRKGGLKIVASMADMAASGGYYIACAADRIVANPGTLTGSVGVIMADLNVSGLMERYGVRYTVIKSGSHKDIFSGFRPMKPQERAILQSMIDDSFRQFRDVVVASRKLGPRDAALISDGRVFTGRQAQKIGLVDDLGSLESAVRIAGKLCGLGEDPVVYEDTVSPWEEFFGGISSMFRGAPRGWQDLPGLQGLQGLPGRGMTGPSLRYQYVP
jgi:protease-4